jgi:hypothetical protein
MPGAVISLKPFRVHTSQVFVFLAIGAMADFGNLRKKMMMLFSVFGCLVTCMFVAVNLSGVAVVISPKAALSSSNDAFLLFAVVLISFHRYNIK